MNKRDLVRSVSSQMSLSYRESEQIINCFLQALEGGLCHGEDISIQGIGTFCLWNQSARVGRNPRTGETCMIRPRTSIKFRPSDKLLNKLNKKEEM